MKKWFLRIFAAATLMIIAVLLVVWLGLRASLPTLDGSIDIDGLQAAATIERDASGIPTITAASRADLAFATGFAHGQDRFFQMDLIRRQAAGELSELVGSAVLDSDKYFRFHRFRHRAKAAMALLSPAELLVLQRYASGVNSGRESLAAKPFEYFVISAAPQDW